MCNLYSITDGQAAIGDLFRVQTVAGMAGANSSWHAAESRPAAVRPPTDDQHA
jgi:hypothetical protein